MKLSTLLAMVGLACAMAGVAIVMTPRAALSQGIPEIRVCTGGKTGKYYETSLSIEAQLRNLVQVTTVETTGSLDNLRKLSSGQCDAAIVQSDAYGIFSATNPTAKLEFERVVPLYDEYVHFVCNANAGIGNVTDLLRGDRSVMIGENGSGTAVTWQTWARQKEDYLSVPTDNVGGNRAITQAIDGTKNQCFLFVSGLGSGTMMNVNELGRGSLRLVTIDDGWFDDVKDPKGQQVYHFADIPKGTYPNLQDGGFFAGGTRTLALQAVLIASTSWINQNGTAYDDFSAAAIRWSQQNK